MNKKLSVVLGILLICCGVFSLAVFLGYRHFNQPMSSQFKQVIYELPPGKPFVSVAKELANLGLVRDPRSFMLLSRAFGFDSHIKVGEYELSPHLAPREILAILASGKSIERKLTIPEGKNVFEIAEIAESAGLCSREKFLERVRTPSLVQELLGENHDSLEGYLFPETYLFTKYTDLDVILKKMVKRALEVHTSLTQNSGTQLLNRHQLFTLASIVEKETGASFERPRIASVFVNRLNKGMALQTDPTVIYGIADEKGLMIENITRSDLQRPTRYNTYQIKGLPPGPISNPGKEALAAALHPDAADSLFFVSRNDGTHEFTTNYEDHLKAVRKFQLDPQARQGKSWRDLKSRSSSEP